MKFSKNYLKIRTRWRREKGRLQYLHIFNPGVCRRVPRNFKQANEKFIFIEGRSFKSLILVWFPACILNQTHHLLIKRFCKSVWEKLDAIRCKVSGIEFNLPGVYTPRRVGSQILVLRLLHFLHAPNQNSKDLEKSTRSCDP